MVGGNNGGSETPALDALRARINDSSHPTLELAQAFQAHLIEHPQSQGELAAKIGISRSLLNQILALLKLPPETQANLKGKFMGEWEIRKILNSIPTDTPEPLNSPSTVDNTSLNSPLNRGPEGLNRSSTGLNRGLNTPLNSYPLLRNTINTLSRLIFFWSKDSGLGELAEQWAQRVQITGWGRVAGLVVLWGLAGYGGWHLTSALSSKLQALWNNTSRLPGALNLPTGQAGLPPGTAPGPKLTGQRILVGNRLELRWEPPGICGGQKCTYRIYWTDPRGDSIDVLGDVGTLGALIEGAHVLRPSGFVYVTAVLPDNTATAASGKFHYETTPLNKQDRIEPLPLTGISVPATAPRLPAGQAGSKPPARGNTKTPLPGASSLEPGASPPPPTGIHVDVRTPNSIRLSWRPVSREVRYNVYSSGSSQLTNLRQENEAPLKSNAVEWIPETGLDRYWIVVTTLAPDGRESAYSEAVEVIRYPEKSGRSAADEAAGVLRKVLPW